MDAPQRFPDHVPWNAIVQIVCVVIIVIAIVTV